MPTPKFKITHCQRLENGDEVHAYYELEKGEPVGEPYRNGRGILVCDLKNIQHILTIPSFSDLKELHETIGNFLKEYENN